MASGLGSVGCRAGRQEREQYSQTGLLSGHCCNGRRGCCDGALQTVESTGSRWTVDRCRHCRRIRVLSAVHTLFHNNNPTHHDRTTELTHAVPVYLWS